MSASREKKQRQNAGPSEKAAKAQQEQAAQKRKTILYSVIAAVVVVLVAALLIWRSGFFQSRATAATVGDESLTTAELGYYYYNARQSVAMYGSYLGFDTSKSDEEQIYSQSENKTYRDYFLEQALEAAKQHKALADEALKNGHTEDEVKEDLNAAIATAKSSAVSNGYGYAAYLKAMYGPYMTSAIYEKLYTRYLLASLVYSDKSTELYDGYTQEELDAYYKNNADTLDTIEYSHLYFPAATVETKDADGNDLPEDEVTKLQDEAKADAKKKAEEALDAVKDGSSFDSQKEKYDLTTGGDHVTAVGTSLLNSAYRDKLLQLDKNSPELVESDNGYYVVSFHDRYLSDEPTKDVRHILVRAESTTDSDNNLVAPTDEAWAAAQEKAESIQAEWESGDKTEDAFIALVEKYSEDTGSNTTGGLYERNTEGRFVAEFNDWVFDASRKPGDVGLVKHAAADSDSNSSKYWGYHLIYMVGDNEPVWMGTARDSLTSDAVSTWLEELMAGYATELADGADELGR